jgi:L-arabinose isomerase
MILGASLLTSRASRRAVSTSCARRWPCSSSTGSAEVGRSASCRPLNFRDDVVEMRHDGPAHLAISEHRPLLRGLGVYHGKRGWGVSVEFDVRHGPATTFGIAQQRDGSFRFVASTGTVVPGPVLQIGNTTSRVDFGGDPGEWVDTWSATGISHHWALGVSDLLPELRATADLLGVELVEVAL